MQGSEYELEGGVLNEGELSPARKELELYLDKPVPRGATLKHQCNYLTDEFPQSSIYVGNDQIVMVSGNEKTSGYVCLKE